METSFLLLQKIFSHFTGLANLYVKKISGIETVQKLDFNNEKLLLSVVDSLKSISENSFVTVCDALFKWRNHKVVSSGIKTQKNRIQVKRSYSRIKPQFDHTISPKDFDKYTFQSKNYSTNLKSIATELVFLYTSLEIFSSYKGKELTETDKKDKDEETQKIKHLFESYIDLCFKQIINFENLLKISSNEDIKILNLKRVLSYYEQLLNKLCEINFEKCSKLILQRYIQEKVNYKLVRVEALNKIFSCISLKVNSEDNLKKSITFLKNIYPLKKKNNSGGIEQLKFLSIVSLNNYEKINFFSNDLLNTDKKSEELNFFENEEWINLMKEYLKLSLSFLKNSKTIFYGLNLMVSCLCCLDQSNFEKNVNSFLQISLNNKLLSNKYKNEIIKILSYFVECIIIRFSRQMDEKIIKKILNQIVDKLFFNTKKSKNIISDEECFPYLISIILSISEYDLIFVMESIVLKLAKSGKTLFPKVSLSIRAFHKLWIKYNKDNKGYKNEEKYSKNENENENEKENKMLRNIKRKNELEKYLKNFENLLKKSVKITDQQIGNINWYSQNKVHQEMLTRDKPEYLRFFYYLSKIIPIILPYPEQIISIFVKYTLHQQQDIALHSFNALKRIVQNQPTLRAIIIHEFSKFISEIPFHFFKLIEFSLNQLNQLLQIWHNDLITEDGFHDIRLLDLCGNDDNFELIVDFDIEKVESICLLMLVYLESDVKILAFKNLELINKINKLLIKQLKEFDYEFGNEKEEEENIKKKLFQQTRVIEIFIKKAPLLFSKTNEYKWVQGNVVFSIDSLFLQYKNLKKIENNNILTDKGNTNQEGEGEKEVKGKTEEEQEEQEEQERAKEEEELLKQYKELIKLEDSVNEYKFINIFTEIIKEISIEIPNIIKNIFPILKSHLKELNDFILKKSPDKRTINLLKKSTSYNLQDEVQRWKNYSMVSSSCCNPEIIEENEIKFLLLQIQRFYKSSIPIQKNAAILSLSKINSKSFNYLNIFLNDISKKIFNKSNKKKAFKKANDRLNSITTVYRLFLDQLSIKDFLKSQFIQNEIYQYIQNTINYFLTSNFDKKLINLTLRYNLFLLFRRFSILINNNNHNDNNNNHNDNNNNNNDNNNDNDNDKDQDQEKEKKKDDDKTGIQKEGKDKFNLEQNIFEQYINTKFKNEEQKKSILEIFINESKSIQFICLQIMSELLKGQIFETDILKNDKSIILSWIYELLLSDEENHHKVAKIAIQNLFQNNEKELLSYYLKKSYSANGNWAKGFVLSICRALHDKKITLPNDELINFLIYNIGSISKSIRIEIVKLWNLYKTEILTEEQIKTLPVITADQAEIPERIYEQRRHLSNLLAHRRKDLSFEVILEATKRYTDLQNEINNTNDFKSNVDIHYRKDCILEYLIHWIKEFEYIHGDPQSKKQFHQIFATLLTITMKDRPLNSSLLDGIWTALSIKSKNISGIVQSLFSCSIGKFQIEYLLTSKQIVHHFNKMSKEKILKIVLKNNLLQFFKFKSKQQDNNDNSSNKNKHGNKGQEKEKEKERGGQKIEKDNSMNKIARLDFVIVLLSEIITQISESLIFLKLPLLLQIIILGFDHKQEFIKRHARLLLSNLILRIVMNKKEIENQLANELSKTILEKITDKNYQFWENETISINNINIESEIKLQHFLTDLLNLFSLFDPKLKANWFKESLTWIVSKSNKEIYENKKHLFIISRSHQIFRCVIDVPTEIHLQELINNFQFMVNIINKKKTEYSWIVYENLKTLKLLITKMQSPLKIVPKIFWTLISLLSTKNEYIIKLILEIFNLLVDQDFIEGKNESENNSNSDSVSIYDLLMDSKPKSFKKKTKFQGLQPLVFNGFKFESTFEITIILLSKLLTLPANQIIQKGNIKFVQNIASLLPFLIEIYPKKNYTFLNIGNDNDNNNNKNDLEKQQQQQQDDDDDDDDEDDEEMKLKKLKKREQELNNLNKINEIIMNSIILNSEKKEFNDLANIIKNFKNGQYQSSPVDFIKAIKKPFFAILTPKFKIKLFEFLLEMIGLCTKKYRINFFLFFEIFFSDFTLTKKNISQMNKKIFSNLIKNIGNEFTGKMTTIINKIINNSKIKFSKDLKIEYETAYSQRSINILLYEDNSITPFYKGLNRFPVLINENEILKIREQYKEQLMKEKEELKLKEMEKEKEKEKEMEKEKEKEKEKEREKEKEKELELKAKKENLKLKSKPRLTTNESQMFLEEIYNLVSTDDEENSNNYHSQNSELYSNDENEYSGQESMSEDNDSNEGSDFFPEFDESQNDISKLIGNYAGDTLRIKKSVTTTPMKNLAAFLGKIMSDEDIQDKSSTNITSNGNSDEENSENMNSIFEKKLKNELKKNIQDENNANEKDATEDDMEIAKQGEGGNDDSNSGLIELGELDDELEKENDDKENQKEESQGLVELGELDELEKELEKELENQNDDKENQKEESQGLVELGELDELEEELEKQKSKENSDNDNDDDNKNKNNDDDNANDDDDDLDDLDFEDDILELERMLTIKETQLKRKSSEIIIEEIIINQEKNTNIKEDIKERNNQFVEESKNKKFDEPVKLLTIINITTKLIQSKVEQYYFIDECLCNLFENILKQDYSNKTIFSDQLLNQFRYNMLYKVDGDKYYTKLNTRLLKIKNEKLHRFQNFLGNRTQLIQKIMNSDLQYIQSLNQLEEIIQNIQKNGFEKNAMDHLIQNFIKFQFDLLQLFQQFLELRKLGRVIVAGTTDVINEYIEKTNELIKKNQNI
ncbi:furry-related [Anaeramoeba flamelloides]|uniref:Furry-related n=1 Tax=Anaeramoeba flamelloides TaxID=1746091 RepID=A0ABQ8Z878_9EUKA|nr:furry-related [Anaeramoeba flamelloides]